MARSNRVSPFVWLLAVGALGVYAWKKYGSSTALIPPPPPPPSGGLIAGKFPGTLVSEGVRGFLANIGHPISDADAAFIFANEPSVMDIKDARGGMWTRTS